MPYVDCCWRKVLQSGPRILQDLYPCIGLSVFPLLLSVSMWRHSLPATDDQQNDLHIFKP